jgi:hypothetical protein
MKSKIIVACIAASLVITFISCDWFKSKDRSKPVAFNIEGQWIIDSVENRSSDSSKNMGLLILALAAQPNEQLGIEFKNDSTFHLVNSTDSAKGQYYLSDDQSSLFIKEDSAFHQLNFVTKTDSSFVAATTDSLVYHLKRK